MTATYYGIEPLHTSTSIIRIPMVPDAEAEQVNPEHSSHQSSDVQPECEICREIFEYTNGVDGCREETTLGTAENVLQSQCSHMALLRGWLQDILAKDPSCAKSVLNIENRSMEEELICFCLQYSPGSDGHYYGSETFGLLRKLTVPDHPGAMRALDPQWIDVGLLKQWITTCDADHGDSCRQLSWLRHLEATRPKYLVDTLKMCVVEGNQIEEEYIALSYQWGQTKTLRNTNEVRERLCEPGSLSDRDLACCIPQTIRDAFGAVRLLGYRYLWVDALCVIQDDYAELAVELRRMHLIYNSACFTIVAADGIDASYGLRGLKDLTAARKHPQELISLPRSEQMAIQHPSRQYSESQDRETYHTRAWTFQEYHFSLRRLVFNMDTVEWHCQDSRMLEDVIRKVPEPVQIRRPSALMRSTIPQQLGTLSPTPAALDDIVNAFNGRSLSFPEDAFPAFAGIQSLLEQVYQPGFLYGLPEFWFELALCWAPNRTLERRVASSSRSSTRTGYQLPSWSWIGWAGHVHFPGNELGDDGAFFGSSFTEPVTTWYTLADPTSQDRRPITSGWHRYRSEAIEGRLINLPEGWIRQADPKRGTVFIRPGHSRQSKWLYPYPVPDPSSTSVSVSVPQTAYLSARTSRAFLCGRRKLTEPYMLREEWHLWLTSPQGQHVGYLHLNNAEEQSLFKHTGSNYSSPNPLELVAICKGISKNMLSPELDWDLEVQRYHDSTWDSYRMKTPAINCVFVLWIEWEDGVAYRRACGVVNAEVWEREREKELVDLILG